MRKQIYNLSCRKQTSGVPGAAPLAVVPLTGQRAGVKGAAPLAGDIFCLLSHSITCIIILII